MTPSLAASVGGDLVFMEVFVICGDRFGFLWDLFSSLHLPYEAHRRCSILEICILFRIQRKSPTILGDLNFGFLMQEYICLVLEMAFLDANVNAFIYR